jgi:hypothetical protein
MLLVLYDVEKSYVNAGEKLVWHRHFYRQSASSVHWHFGIWVSSVPLVTD